MSREETTMTAAQPVFETERLRLRALAPSDAGLMALYSSDERVARMTRSIPHPLPPGATEAFIERVLSGEEAETVWVIEHKGSMADGLIGIIGLQDDNEIGYWIGAPFWSTGFATEAVEVVVAWALAEGRGPLRAEVFQDNPASAKVLTKAGFAYVGDGTEFSVARNAEVQVWWYSLEHEAWARTP